MTTFMTWFVTPQAHTLQPLRTANFSFLTPLLTCTKHANTCQKAYRALVVLQAAAVACSAGGEPGRAHAAPDAPTNTLTAQPHCEWTGLANLDEPFVTTPFKQTRAQALQPGSAPLPRLQPATITTTTNALQPHSRGLHVCHVQPPPLPRTTTTTATNALQPCSRGLHVCHVQPPPPPPTPCSPATGV